MCLALVEEEGISELGCKFWDYTHRVAEHINDLSQSAIEKNRGLEYCGEGTTLETGMILRTNQLLSM